MLQGLEFDSAFTTLRKCIGYASIIGLAAFCYRLYQVRMLVRRAQKDHGVVSDVRNSVLASRRRDDDPKDLISFRTLEFSTDIGAYSL
jgi:hypothetical protein